MTNELNFAEYAADWPSRFMQLRTTYLRGLPVGATVEHVGSTAVPGLPAKDCIDIVVTVPAEDLQTALVMLAASDFEHRPTSFSEDPERFFLHLLGPQRQRVAHLHLMAEEHFAAAEMVAVRDLLRRDMSWRKRYTQIKRNLAEQFPMDRPSYLAGKDSFVRDMTAAAVQ